MSFLHHPCRRSSPAPQGGVLLILSCDASCKQAEKGVADSNTQSSDSHGFIQSSLHLTSHLEQASDKIISKLYKSVKNEKYKSIFHVVTQDNENNK